MSLWSNQAGDTFRIRAALGVHDYCKRMLVRTPPALPFWVDDVGEKYAIRSFEQAERRGQAADWVTYEAALADYDSSYQRMLALAYVRQGLVLNVPDDVTLSADPDTAWWQFALAQIGTNADLRSLVLHIQGFTRHFLAEVDRRVQLADLTWVSWETAGSIGGEQRQRPTALYKMPYPHWEQTEQVSTDELALSFGLTLQQWDDLNTDQHIRYVVLHRVRVIKAWWAEELAIAERTKREEQ